MDRRSFLRGLGGAAAALVGGAPLVAAARSSPAAMPVATGLAADGVGLVQLSIRWVGTQFVLEVANPTDEPVGIQGTIRMIDTESGLVVAEMPQVQCWRWSPHDPDDEGHEPRYEPAPPVVMSTVGEGSIIDWGRLTL